MERQRIARPHHKFIYGAPIKYNKEIEVIPPFKKFYLPKRDGSEYYWIGFQYGQIDELYDKMKYSYDSLQLCSSKPSQEMIDLFASCYPKLTGKTYVLYQDVYTSKFANGCILYGYEISHFGDEFGDQLWEFAISGEEILNLNVKDPGHNMENGTLSSYFIGEILTDIDNNEDVYPRYMNKMVKTLTRRYKPTDTLPSRSNILTELRKMDGDVELSQFPMIVVIQSMCHCCT